MHRSDSWNESLGRAVRELASFINDPRQDWRPIAEAGLDLDPAFLPLLVRRGDGGPANVVELAGELGRDHSTMSRQVARLEDAGLVERVPSETDGRVRNARVTAEGGQAVAALSAARRRLFDRTLADWSAADREALAELLGRFVISLKDVTTERR